MSVPTIEVADYAALPAQPLISVHMLAYRHEATLARAIDSVVKQKLDVPFELIIAEDHSPDHTLAIALEYQRRYPSIIRVLHADSNVGMMANVERMIGATRGSLVAVCEGDDFWLADNKLQLQLDIMRDRPRCALVFHAANVVDHETGRVLTIHRRSLYSRIFSTREVILGDGGLIPTASILVRHEAIVNQPPWQHDAPVGDYPLVLRAAFIGEVVYIDRVMSAYRVNQIHSWSSAHHATLQHRLEYAQKIDCMLAAFSAWSDHAFDREAKRMASKYYSDVVATAGGAGTLRREIFTRYREKMHGLDLWVAWYAAATGRTVPRAKALARKIGTLARLIGVHFKARRVELPPRDAAR